MQRFLQNVTEVWYAVGLVTGSGVAAVAAAGAWFFGQKKKPIDCEEDGLEIRCMLEHASVNRNLLLDLEELEIVEQVL